MNRGFWDNVKTPAFVLAPMADVTDSAFRQIIAKYGKPDAFYTEFVSCDGLMSSGRERVMRDLYYTEAERPLVAQVFGSKPENFYKTAQLVRSLGFDGLDINMGCPEKNVVKQGSCSDLIRHPELAKEIVAAAKEGAGELPVSVKTRIGFNAVELESWCGHLLEARPVKITFHWRTRKEMSKVPAHWELAHIPVAMAKGTGVMIFGNGDVESVAEARRKAAETGVDGVMIGRGIFGTPWLFSEREDVTVRERLSIMLEHTKLYWDLYGPTDKNREIFNGYTKSFALMKKHYKAYVKGFDGAGELREKLMAAETAEEVEMVVQSFFSEAPAELLKTVV